MQIVLIVIAIPIALIVLMWSIGSFLPKKHRATVSYNFDVKPEKIWKLVSNVKDYDRWRTHLKAVEYADEKTWAETDKRGQKVPFEIIESIENQLLIVEISDKNLPFGGQWVYELKEREPGKTSLTITENGEIYNPVFRFISTLFFDQSATLKQYMEQLKNETSTY